MLYVTVPKKLLKELVSKLGRNHKLVDGFIKGRPGFRDNFFSEVGKDLKPGREILPKSLLESMAKAAGIEIPGLKHPRQLKSWNTGDSSLLDPQKIKVRNIDREGEGLLPSKRERREQARKDSAWQGSRNQADRRAYLEDERHERSWQEANNAVNEFFKDREENPRRNWQKRRRS